MDRDIIMLGQRLKQLRTRMNHTQDSLAEVIGTNARQVWRWENMESEPNNDYLIAIARALDVSTDYLLGLTDDPTSHDEMGLSETEKNIVTAYRRGDKIEAVRAIVAGV